MASLVAARRTDSSYPKFLASTNPSDLIVQPNGGSGMLPGADHLPRPDCRASPCAAGWRRPPQSRPRPSRRAAGSAPCSNPRCSSSPAATDMFSDQDRVTITAGRAVNPAHPDEVVASTRAAALLHLHVGSRLPVGVWSWRPSRKLTPFYRKLDLTVVGIGVFNTQVLQDDIDSGRTGFLLGAPALAREFGSCCTRTSTSACGWPAEARRHGRRAGVRAAGEHQSLLRKRRGSAPAGPAGLQHRGHRGGSAAGDPPGGHRAGGVRGDRRARRAADRRPVDLPAAAGRFR